jgi:hypothetical protein
MGQHGQPVDIAAFLGLRLETVARKMTEFQP